MTNENNNENLAQQTTIAEKKLEPSSDITAKEAFSHLNFTIVIAAFAFILALTAAVEAYLNWHRSEAWQRKTKITINQLQNVTQNSQQTLQQVNKKILITKNQIAQQQQQLQQLQTSLNQAINNNTANTKNWVLIQTAHLFQLATLNLQYNHDIGGAIILLQTAKQQLLTLNDSSLMSLQQALSNNILALKAVPRVQVADLLTRFMALSVQISKLPLVNNTQVIANQQGQPTSEQVIKPRENWYTRVKQMLLNSWNEFKKMIVIRHQTLPIEPLMSAPQQATLVKNIQLLFGQAQWAVLHNDARVYQLSLNQAKQAIKKYFATNATQTKAVLAEIEVLQKININPSLPDLSATQQIINQLLLQSGQMQPVTSQTTVSLGTNNQEVPI